MFKQGDLFEVESRDPILALKTYREFREALARSGCERCDLAGGRTKIVVDRGSPVARAMIIGEGPGADEDRQGLAFVGRAGRLLDEMMEAVGLETDRDFLVANVVKCRPPENRAPRTEEARACYPYLERQIELVGPRILVLLGATAVKYMLPDPLAKKPISGLVGTFVEHPGLPGVDVFTVFHPAYILRNPYKRPEMERHLRALRERMMALAHERN